MGVSFNDVIPMSPMERLHDITFRDPPEPQELTSMPHVRVGADEQVETDISGDAFGFVRSIRVYHIQYRQDEGRGDNCIRSDLTRLGSYGVQGDYRWTGSNVSQVPAASGLSIPKGCRSYYYRSVFVDWRDHAGNYGSEEVHY